jgi:hypothetical protein
VYPATIRKIEEEIINMVPNILSTEDEDFPSLIRYVARDKTIRLYIRTAELTVIAF